MISGARVCIFGAELNAEFSFPKNKEWSALSRLVVFVLASSSIVCLMLDFYGICPMRIFAPFGFLPAFVALCLLAVWDRTRGEGYVWRAVWIGLLGGLISAVSYDVFRLPFVFAKEWGLDGFIAPMPLFKVFPRFGAMILGEPIEQATYSMAAQVLGWLYHFSNGATFGVMYLTLVGDARRRHWLWAVLFAVALELGMLLTPYPQVFGIAVTAHFVVVTMAAHAIFGVGLGFSVRWLAGRASCKPAM